MKVDTDRTLFSPQKAKDKRLPFLKIETFAYLNNKEIPLKNTNFTHNLT